MTKKILISAIVIASLFSIHAVSFSAAKSKAADPVVLEFWENDGPGQQAVLDTFIAEFHSANPSISVKRTHYDTDELRRRFIEDPAGEHAPDVILGPNDNLSYFVPDNLLAPVDEVLGKEFLALFALSPLEASMFNGRIYMIPDRQANELCLIYNRKLVPTPPSTWEEMNEMAEKLKKTGDVRYTIAISCSEPAFTLPMLRAFGGRVLDNPSSNSAKPTLDTPQVKEWMRWLKKIHSDRQIPDLADYDTASDLFLDGKAAFLINGPWSFPNYTDSYGMDIGVAAIPKVNGCWSASFFMIKGYSISRAASSNAEKRKAVKLFIRHMTGRKCQLQMMETGTFLPALIEALADPAVTGDPLLAGQLDALSKAVPMPALAQMSAVWTAIKIYQQKMFSGKISPDDAPRLMQQKAEHKLKAVGIN